MKNSINLENILYKRNKRVSISSKVWRYILERKLSQLSHEYIFYRRQLAIFSFDYVSTSILLDGIYEVDELEIFMEWLIGLKNKKIFEGIALDIGANIGNHSLFFSDYYKKVLSFEPNFTTFQLLSINSKIVNNVECFNYGISSTDNVANFEINMQNIGGGRVISEKNTSEKKVNLRRLDSLSYINMNNIKLIKIDVEGHEYEVLQGAAETIKKQKPLIIFEQHISDFVNNRSKAIELIKSYGYNKFACIEKSPSPVESWPVIFKLAYSTIYRFLFGSVKSIVEKKSFDAKFYSFIIAIPEWMDETENN